MPTAAINLDELNGQTRLALAAGKKAATAVQRNRLLHGLERALWAFVRSYWAIFCLIERAVDSGEFDAGKFRALHGRTLPLERMADDLLETARRRDYFTNTLTAAPLLSLQACNERI